MGSTLLGLLGIFAVNWNRSIQESFKPVLKQVFPSVAGLLILLFIGSGAALLFQENRRLNERFQIERDAVWLEFHVDLETQATGLKEALQLIASEPGVQAALAERDAERLFWRFKTVFDTFSREHEITLFKFLSADRVNLLRLNNPELRGDVESTHTILQAERTGNTASGIELKLGSRKTIESKVVNINESIQGIISVHPRL